MSARRAAVLGSPIAHSRSPQLHLAAYRALGLDGWTYDRIECTADELPICGRRFRTGMGGRFGDDAGQVRRAAVRRRAHPARGAGGSGQHPGADSTGWRADNTDIDGVTGALGAASGHAIVVGSGGTAPAVVVGLVELGVQRITVVARNREKVTAVVDLATKVGVDARWCDIDGPDVAQVVATADAVVNTIPADAAARYASVLATTPVLLDAIYDPWPTPLASAVEAAGGRVISGLQMLLHQAFAQVEQFTGLPAPKEAMRAALLSH